MKFRIVLFFIICFQFGSTFSQTKKQISKDIKEIQFQWQHGELDKGLKTAKKALSDAEKIQNDSLKGIIYNEIGIIYDFKGKYSKSLNYYFKAEKLSKKHNDQGTLGYIYCNIGLIYGVTMDFKQARKYYNKSLKIREKLKDSYGVSAVYNNLAITYMNSEIIDTAILYYNKSINIDLKNNDVNGVNDSYNNIGICHMRLKQYDKAEYYFKMSLKMAKKNNRTFSILNSLNNLGSVYEKVNKNQEAKKCILEGMDLAKKVGDKKSLSYCYNLLTNLYENEKDYKKALDYQKKFYDLERERLGENNISEMAKLELKYEFDKKQEIEKEKLARSEAESKMNYILLISACIVLIFVLFMSVFLYRKWKQTILQKQEIDLKNNLLNEQNDEIFQSINYAQRIQHALLPSFDKINSIFEKNSLLYLPKDIISGDFYWAFETKTHKYIAVADCTGHGVPGAMMNMICHNALNRSILEFQSTIPGEILTKTRDIIVAELSRKDENVNDGMDISLIAIDSTTQQLFWSGAHNDLWILRKESKTIETINALNQPIGKHIGYSNFETHEFFVASGDRLVLLTDGFGDQFGGPKNKKFKDSNLKKLLLENQNKSLAENTQILEKTFFDWKRDEAQIDDVCILLIEI